MRILGRRGESVRSAVVGQSAIHLAVECSYFCLTSKSARLAVCGRYRCLATLLRESLPSGRMVCPPIHRDCCL